MEAVLTAVPLVVFIPLMGMLINLFFGKYFGEAGVGMVAVAASGSAFIVSLLLWAGLVANDYEAVVVDPPLLESWIRIPGAAVDIPWQFRVDTLSVTMMLVVSGVGTLIHLYSIGYMHGDSRFPRFFVYLNLFLAFMMTLVTGNNLLMMFVGWEGVGLCSFLLIGFWFDKPGGIGWKNANAARKAFIVNRVGDFGLLMAIFLTFHTFGTLDFYKAGEQPIAAHHGEDAHAAEGDHGAATETHGEEAAAEGDHSTTEETHSEEAATTEEAHGEASTEHAAEGEEHAAPAEMGIFNQAQTWLDEGGHQVSFGVLDMSLDNVLVLITLFMLLGAAGKSAQIPLFVWLPDAMAGPTPVSALIHAATMVTAGVYMMVRSNVFFEAAELSSFVVTVIGCATAIMAGFVAVGQWDVKRVLAYSTVSQLGFMVAAVGLGAYGAAMFHLVTHAFFKALLFLGSGSIIHGMEHGHHHLHDHAHGHGHDHEPGHDPHVAEHTDPHGLTDAVHHDPTDHHDENQDNADHAHDDKFDPQDMRLMGGLRHKMPITYWTYLLGTLALAGIFPFAGFWSKDEILADAFKVFWDEGEIKGAFTLLILLAAAAFTAFYMWRQMCLVFYGKARHAAAEHASEGGWVMTVPLLVLAVLSVFAGFMNIPSGTPLFSWLLGDHKFTSWLEHSVVNAHAGTFLIWLALGAVALAGGAIFLARSLYNDATLAGIEERDPLEENPQAAQGFALANARLYWDETYFRFLENPFNQASRWLAKTLDWDFWHDFVHERIIYGGFHQAAHGLSRNVDRGAVDQGIMGATALSIGFVASRLRRIQTGYVRTYAVALVLGTVIVVLVILLPVIRELLGI